MTNVTSDTAAARTQTPITANQPVIAGPINSALAAQLNALLAERNGTTIPTGFFAWWGDATFPDGTSNVPVLSQQDFARYYNRLQQAALDPSLITPITTLTALTAEFRPDGPLPIAIARFALSTPQPAFMTRVMEAAKADVALNPPPPPLADVIQPANAFLVSGLMHDQWGQVTPKFRSRIVTYTFDERFYSTNPGGPNPDLIEIDCHDGRGFRAARFGSRITATYATGDAATATVRCHYGPTVLEGQLSVPILDVDAAPLPDDTWSLTGIPSLNTGTAYVYRAAGHATVVNPIIIAEGFPGGYPSDYLYDVVNQQGTLESLRTAGYDVILLSFTNGLDAIQKNADVAIACIRQCMAQTKAPLVVGGLSMGGLITRYALAALESRGFPHNTRLYFTVDTPHGGAYTNLADQWLASYLAPASAEAAAVAMLLGSTSNQQFMMLTVADGTAQASPLRTEFLRELNGLGGYPQKPEKIAVSSGRGDGVRSIPAGSRLLTWSGGPFAALQLVSLGEGESPSLVAHGYSFLADAKTGNALSVASPISWEGAPGGLNIYNAVAQDIIESIGFGNVADPIPVTCAVPTVSALDIDPTKYSPFAPVPAPSAGASPFNDYICSAENTPHLTITPETGAWLVGKIGSPPAATTAPTPVAAPAAAPKTTAPKPAPAFDPSAFNPHDPAYSANPYPTYAQFRKNAPVFWVEPYNSYWVFRYEDAMRVFNDSDNFGPAPGPPAPPGVNDYIKNRIAPPPAPPAAPFDVLANLPEGLFFLDPPEHGHVRGLIEPLFLQSIQNATTVAAIAARQALVAAKQSGVIELYTSYALPMPAAVLMTAMGLPQRDWMGLGAWIGANVAGHDITQPVGVQAAGATSFMAINAYLNMLMRGCPFGATKGGLLDLMMENATGPGKMDSAQVQTTTANLLIAGYLSTTFLIATGTYNLLRTNQVDLLRQKPELLMNAINEMLRFDAPAQLVDRYVAKQSVTLGGRQLIEGDPVTVVLGSANHDESVFPDAETFDITRTFDPKWPHLGFGWGIHHCIGAPLVMGHTAPVAFQTLLDELPSFSLAGTPQWQTDPYLRSVSNLPLSIGK
jgi:cytochrome P450